MKESEAKEKWCPFSKLLYDGFKITSINRNHVKELSEDDPKCLGSECMLWRWSHTSEGRYGGSPLPLPRESWEGYCGGHK